MFADRFSVVSIGVFSNLTVTVIVVVPLAVNVVLLPYEVVTLKYVELLLVFVS